MKKLMRYTMLFVAVAFSQLAVINLRLAQAQEGKIVPYVPTPQEVVAGVVGAIRQAARERPLKGRFIDLRYFERIGRSRSRASAGMRALSVQIARASADWHAHGLSAISAILGIARRRSSIAFWVATFTFPRISSMSFAWSSEAGCGFQQAHDLLRAQNHRQLARLAHERHAIRDLAVRKRHGEKEP